MLWISILLSPSPLRMKHRFLLNAALIATLALPVASFAAVRTDIFALSNASLQQHMAAMNTCHQQLLTLIMTQNAELKAFRAANPHFGRDKTKREAYVAMIKAHAAARQTLIKSKCMQATSAASMGFSSVSTSRSSASSQSSLSSVSTSRSSMSSVSSMSTSRSSMSSSAVSMSTSRSSVSSSPFWPGFPF